MAGFAPRPKKNMENSTKKKSDGILLLARRYTPLQKYEGYLYTLIYLKVRRRKVCEKVQLKGCIYEVNFGYNAKMEVYTNSSSDMTKLYEIGCTEVIIK